MTPYEKQRSLPGAEGALKPGMSFEILDTLAYEMSDNDAVGRQCYGEKVAPPFGKWRR
ncbi:MAG: hypothetical protein L0H73_17795 [Nitrococcus sp.]|nr:hypothetical protein [Nitrococcus sp.]